MMADYFCLLNRKLCNVDYITLYRSQAGSLCWKDVIEYKHIIVYHAVSNIAGQNGTRRTIKLEKPGEYTRERAILSS